MDTTNAIGTGPGDALPDPTENAAEPLTEEEERKLRNLLAAVPGGAKWSYEPRLLATIDALRAELVAIAQGEACIHGTGYEHYCGECDAIVEPDAMRALRAERDGLQGLYRGACRVFQALARDERDKLGTVNEDYQGDVDAVIEERVALRARLAEAEEALRSGGGWQEHRWRELEADLDAAREEVERLRKLHGPSPRDFDCPDCAQKRGTPCTVRGDYHVKRTNLACEARKSWIDPLNALQKAWNALREDAMWGWDDDSPPRSVKYLPSVPGRGSMTCGPNNCRRMWKKRRAALAAMDKALVKKGAKCR